MIYANRLRNFDGIPRDDEGTKWRLVTVVGVRKSQRLLRTGSLVDELVGQNVVPEDKYLVEDGETEAFEVWESDTFEVVDTDESKVLGPAR